MNRIFLTLSIAAACVTSVSAAPLSFQLVPGANISASAPLTPSGWGYRLENTSATSWLELTGFSSDPFAQGTPLLLFDFPILSPGQIVTVNWAAGTAGLLEFAFDAGTANGATNSGSFVLDASVWDGDPLLPSSTFQGIDTASAAYSITLRTTGGGVIPEPSTMLLSASGLLALWLKRR